MKNLFSTLLFVDIELCEWTWNFHLQQKKLKQTKKINKNEKSFNKILTMY